MIVCHLLAEDEIKLGIEVIIDLFELGSENDKNPIL